MPLLNADCDKSKTSNAASIRNPANTPYIFEKVCSRASISRFEPQSSENQLLIWLMRPSMTEQPGHPSSLFSSLCVH